MSSVDYKRELKDLVDVVVSENGSDLHFSVGAHPMVRVAGSLVPLVKKPILTDQDLEGFAQVLMSTAKFEEYKEDLEADFSYAHADGVRFRGNSFFQSGSMAVALRLIPNKIRTIAELGLPPILESFVQRPQGFSYAWGQ